MDYGRYKYEQSKKEKEAKKTQKVATLREVRIRPKIGDHDFDAKARLAKKLIDGGDKVKITVMFRGREITHPDIAWKLLQRMAEFLKDVASVEGKPQMEGRRMHVVMTPGAAPKPKNTEKVEVEKA